MTKTFPLLPDITCPGLAGYKLPSVEDGKPEFSERQVRRAIEMARETIKHPDYDFVYEDESEIIASLRTTRTPIAIEVEMWPSIPGKDDKEIPKTNPDGTVKVVKWIFND